nr:thioesterase domain-containing protein [uncultured Gellertiella sp.]
MNMQTRSEQVLPQDGQPRSASVRVFARPDNPRFVLVCFPCAGASASFYRDWRKEFGTSEVLAAIQPPGREDRRDEPFAVNLREMAEAIARDLRLQFPEAPLVFFGHSFGALVAYETGLAMQRAGGRGPSHLFASGRIAPRLRKDHGLRAAFNDQELVDELRNIGFEHVNLLGLPVFLRLFLPVLRADLLLNDHYTDSGEQLACPLTAFSGSHDALAPAHLVAAWESQTSGPFSHHVFPGGHFYLRPRFADLSASMRAIINMTLQPSQSRSERHRHDHHDRFEQCR